MIRTFCAGLVGLAGLTSGAMAQAPCEAMCKASLDEEVIYAAPINRQSPERIAELSVMGGQVLQSAVAGMSPIETQAGLRIGDQVTLTEGSQATLSGPADQAQITGPALLNVVAAGNCGCVTQTPVQTFAQFDEQGNQADQPGLLFAAGAVAAFGGGAAILMAVTDDDDDAPIVTVPVSP